MAINKTVFAALSTISATLFISDRRLHVARFLLPALLIIAILTAVAYFLEARNWSFGGSNFRRIRRTSDEVESY